MVVPDQTRLDPGAIQVAPFEVMRGTQAADVRTGIHRQFQYEYTLRYAGSEFGREVSLPPLTITYRVQNRTTQDAAIEGREHQYVLPALNVRVLSLVPAINDDIRDETPETFRETDARRSRASLLRVVAGALYVIGGMVIVAGMAPAVRGRTRRAAAAAARASEGAILGAAARELDEVRRLRRIQGWDDALAGRALAALRLAATDSAGRAAAQSPPGNASPVPGQIAVPRSWPKRGATLVSSAVTAVTVTTGRSKGAAHAAELAAAMTRLTAKAYGRNASTVADAALDEALEVGVQALTRARRMHTWPARTQRMLRTRLARLTNREVRL